MTTYLVRQRFTSRLVTLTSEQTVQDLPGYKEGIINFKELTSQEVGEFQKQQVKE